MRPAWIALTVPPLEYLSERTLDGLRKAQPLGSGRRDFADRRVESAPFPLPAEDPAREEAHPLHGTEPTAQLEQKREHLTRIIEVRLRSDFIDGNLIPKEDRLLVRRRRAAYMHKKGRPVRIRHVGFTESDSAPETGRHQAGSHRLLRRMPHRDIDLDRQRGKQIREPEALGRIEAHFTARILIGVGLKCILHHNGVQFSFSALIKKKSIQLLSMKAVLIFLLASMAANAHADVRLKRTVNDGWRYIDGPIDRAAEPDFDDGEWQRINLPHTWNAEDAADKTPGYRQGVGWYRKALALEPALEGRRLFLYFEGANTTTDLYVNGRHAGNHVGGYTAFVFDVTDLVRFDAPNTLAVRVDNVPHSDVPPLDADFTFFGGIYRDVWLIATDPVHVKVTDHASPGVYIDTDDGVVRIRGTVVNHTSTAVDAELVHEVFDADNVRVARSTIPVSIAASDEVAFESRTEPVADYRRWSPSDPYLYHVVTEVHVDGDVRDRITNPIGFRTFRVTPDSGLFVNGEQTPLYGTNRHQDYPGYGNALPDEFHRRDVQIIKDDGFNFLRLAHYPQDPAVLEEADRLGLIVWEEIPVVNLITMSDAFRENAETWLVEMIRQHYNHPSVFMWGYMNEVMLVKPDPVPDGYYQAVYDLGKHLDDLVRKEDATRLTVTAQSQGEIYNGVGISDIPDILGMNLYFGWYYNEFETFGDFLDELHAEHPNRPLLVSEYGAGSDERVHTTDPVRFDFSSEYMQHYHTASFPQIMERSYVVGSAVWNQFDFASEGRQDTKNAVNQKGLYFQDRTPKDIAYYYRAHLLDEPVLHVAQEWNRRAYGNAQPVWVYTNQQAVELLVNGESQGVQQVENAIAEWTVDLREGVNTVEALSGEHRDAVEIFVQPNLIGGGGTVLAVNAGAHYSYEDEAGVVYQRDRAYEFGSWGYVGGDGHRTHHRIYHTVDDPLYQSRRQGMSEYRFDVPAGEYEVEFGFAESEFDDAGNRVFSVAINGRPFISGLDAAAAYNRYVAFSRRIRTSVEGDEGLIIRFEPTIDEAIVNVIVVRRVSE